MQHKTYAKLKTLNLSEALNRFYFKFVYIYLTRHIGGSDGANVFNRVWRYNSQVNEWSEVASMLHAREYHGSVALNSYIYVVSFNNYCNYLFIYKVVLARRQRRDLSVFESSCHLSTHTVKASHCPFALPNIKQRSCKYQ